ncbi:hypothetical protein MBLNU230_g4566t1 [Neophaeotheca triangularis]
MAQTRLPAITLTDPQNEDSAPNLAQSPVKEDGGGYRVATSAAGRPATPVSMSGSSMMSGRPDDSSNSVSSPLRQERSSQNASSFAANGGGGGKMDGQLQMDPLTQQIFNRTSQPQGSLAAGQRPATPDSATNHDERASKDKNPAPPVQTPSRSETHRADGTDPITAQKDLKKGVKAVSFLSRLMGNKKQHREQAEQPPSVEEESALSDHRPEGNDAQVFAHSVDNMGYNPRHPQPPAYIKVRTKNKIRPDFDRLFLAQELGGPGNGGKESFSKPERRDSSANKLRRKSSLPNTDTRTVWAMEFSKDGKYLASAGGDGVLRVWAVLSTPEDRQKHESLEARETTNGQDTERLNAPVFQSAPWREFAGHTSTILDVSWSKNNFLLSSSMDKTVRLWHVTRPECLLTFKHNDYVPSIAFHPKDDRFFLAGSLDSKLRLWSIPEKSVAFSTQLPDMITAVAFTPDGKSIVAGCLSGLCMFYETEGLRYQTQIHVRSTRGQNAKGSKITGIHAYNDSVTGDVKLLVTSNDSRIRVYNFRDKSLELKLRGNLNTSSQIRATLSDDGRYIACGSEDHRTHIWSPFEPTLAPATDGREKKPMECFETSDTIATAVCFAPTKTKLCLSRADDPLYDLCNPPPVTLRSRAERAESRASSSKPPTENGSVLHTPADSEFKVPARPNRAAAREEEISATWVQRAAHRNGNIIVTADYNGLIKVFRQDCAWSKRRLDTDDRASSIFSKRGGGSTKANGRPGSLATKNSSRSLHEREGRASTSTQPPSERIMTWRQGVASTPSVAETGAEGGTKASSRSISPRKSLGALSKTDASSLRNQVPASSTAGTEHHTPAQNPANTNSEPKQQQQHQSQPPQDPQENYGAFRTEPEDSNPLMMHGGASYLYWNTQEWKQRQAQFEEQKHPAPLRPPGPNSGASSYAATELSQLSLERAAKEKGALGRGDSFASRLSDEVRDRDGRGDREEAGGGDSGSEGEDRFEEARER